MSNQLINVKVDVTELEDNLSKLSGYISGKVTNMTVTEIAARGRKEFTHIEAGMFQMGARQTTTKGKRSGFGRETRVFSRLGSNGTAWVSMTRKSKEGHDFQMDRFKWLQRANSRLPVSLIRYASTMASLYENDTKPYAGSISGLGISRNGKDYGPAGFAKGQVRKGRKYFFTRQVPVMNRHVSDAIAHVDKKLSEEFAK